MEKLNSNIGKFFIHYEYPKNQNSVDLEIFGKSIIGFNKLLKDLYKISKINSDIEIKVDSSKKGSIILEILLETFISNNPFENLQDLLNFLKVSEPQLFTEANNFFSEVGFSEKNQTSFWDKVIKGETNFQIQINEFADKRPAEFWALSTIGTGLGTWITFYLIPKFLKWLFQKALSIKNKNTPDEKTPISYFTKLKKLLPKFKKPLIPFVENEINAINFSLDGKKTNPENAITTQNFGNLLPEKEQILPNFLNGRIYEFSGEIKNFQSSRGDFLKIKIRIGKKKLLIIAIPSENHSTEEFIPFYKKTVKFKAEVLRESLYQKPKLKIIPETMSEIQEEMF